MFLFRGVEILFCTSPAAAGTPWTTVVEHEAGVVLEQFFAFADGGLAIKARRNGRDEVSYSIIWPKLE